MQATTAPAQFPPEAAGRADYDMVDEPERDGVAASPRLAKALLDYAELLRPQYHRADQMALRQQARHRTLALVAAVSGTLAVVGAIGQLAIEALHREHTPFSPWAGGMELAAVVLGFVAVIVGLVLRFHRGWLLERHKAELCRLAKFRFLVDDRLWCDSPEVWKDAVRETVDRIKSLRPEVLEEHAKEDRVPPPPARLAACALTAADRRALVTYHGGKRISYQRAYFRTRADRFSKRARMLSHVVPILFFSSIVAALAHFLLDYIKQYMPAPHVWHESSLVLIACAAALPAIGAGIRTYRGSHEFGRSAALFEAKAAAMADFAARLERARGDTADALTIMWECEDFLERENREWLRLMLEAEWF